MTLASDLETAQRLNHVEMVYRPGERHLATRVFELLGMRVVDNGGEWLFALVDPSVGDASNNACYASEVTPEQWTLEQTLASAMASGDSPGGRTRRGRIPTRCRPSRSTRSTSGSATSTGRTSTRPSTASRTAATDPDLAGHAALLGIYDPSEPGAYALGMFQAFVRTDVVAGGLLALGQLIELQWHLPNS